MQVRTGIILAAGTGARLDRPDSPKPLVKVGNKPLIVWAIEDMQDRGVERIIVTVGHRAEEVKKELTASPFVRAKLEFVEQQDSSKGGALRSLLAAAEKTNEGFFLSMADLVLEKNPYDSIQPHVREKGGMLTALVDMRKETAQQSGALSMVTVAQGIIRSIGRNLKKASGREVGVYFVPKSAVAALRTIGKATPSLDAALQKLAKAGKLAAAELGEGEWYDVNTPATHIKAEVFARESYRVAGKAPRKEKLLALAPVAQFSRFKRLHTDIVIESGIIGRLSEVEVIPESSMLSTHFLLTDDFVDQLYGDKVIESFRRAGFDMRKLVVPAGEKSKSASEFLRLSDEIFTQGLDKQSVIVSLGGGVVNNIAGFLASTLYRGVGLIHLPTSSMAQVDAAIDFKQAINSSKGKNLIGSYYPASKIIIDPEALRTLPKRHLINGISESIKHALTQDTEFLGFLLKNAKRLSNGAVLEHIVRRTVELKVPLLSGDVHDDYNEMIPQYGHSIGHAVEHLSSYELLHGEAIAIGMCISAEVALLLGITDQSTVDLHYAAFKAYALPTEVPDDMEADDIMNVIRYDKHHVKGVPYMALPLKAGEMFHKKEIYGIPIPYEVLKRAIVKNKAKR